MKACNYTPLHDITCTLHDDILNNFNFLGDYMITCYYTKFTSELHNITLKSMDFYIIHYILDVMAKEFHGNFIVITILRRSPRFPIMGGTVLKASLHGNSNVITTSLHLGCNTTCNICVFLL